MSQSHQVAQGECLASIADKYSLSEGSIWDDPANASLKAKRKTGYILFPGDVVVIPDKPPPKTVQVATGKLHSFRTKKRAGTVFHLVMKDGLGEPRAALRYTLIVGGKKLAGATDANGELKQSIPPAATVGNLIFGEGDDQDEIEVHFGHLDPITEVSGVKQRLLNLGFDPGAVDDQSLSDEAEAAIEVFQRHCGLTATGKIDAATRKKLEERYGS